MTPQAQNSLKLYQGGHPGTIEQLLRLQKKNVVEELKAHFKASDLKELAVKLSLQPKL